MRQPPWRHCVGVTDPGPERFLRGLPHAHGRMCACGCGHRAPQVLHCRSQTQTWQKTPHLWGYMGGGGGSCQSCLVQSEKWKKENKSQLCFNKAARSELGSRGGSVPSAWRVSPTSSRPRAPHTPPSARAPVCPRLSGFPRSRSGLSLMQERSSLREAGPASLAPSPA